MANEFSDSLSKKSKELNQKTMKLIFVITLGSNCLCQSGVQCLVIFKKLPKQMSTCNFNDYMCG